MSGATLNRFYSLHYLFPFVLAGTVAVHVILLHEGGSNNPTGLRSDVDKVTFHVYYSVKDAYGFLVLAVLLTLLVFYAPN